MAEENKHEKALTVFRGLCAFLDGEDWKYDKDTEELIIRLGAEGKNLLMDMVIRVDEDRQVFQTLSELSFEVPEDVRMDMAVAVSVVNRRLVDGSFNYNIPTGRITFRMACCYIDSDLGKDLYKYLILCSFRTIDEYNDKFLRLVDGQVEIQDFISEEMK